MRTITLIRTRKAGLAVTGELSFEMLNRNYENETFTQPTLENADYIIPPGIYPVERTWSPRLKKALPEILDVPEYSDPKVTGVPDGCQQSASGGESKGRSCPTDLAERYRSLQSPCRMRQGIRIHMGSKPEHSKGCILLDMLGMSNINCLLNQLEENEDEKVQIEIVEHFAL